jgi:LCP family protein required for cell wall assembly
VAPAATITDTAADSTGPADEIVPLPSLGANAANSRPPAKPKKRSWYKRPLFVVPLILLLLVGGTAGVVAWQTRAALDDVHSISTPPPEIPASTLGGAEDLTIDTGPAQAALDERENREQQLPLASRETPPDETATIAPTSSGTASTPIAGNQFNVADVVQTPGTPPAGISPAPDSGTPSPALATDEPSPAIVPTAPANVATGDLTILLMGVDSRDGEAIDIGVRPDSLAILHINQESGSCRILAVPRDSRAELPGYGYSKINHALAVAGIPYEMLVVEEYLGLEIDNYALIDFAGLESVVDSLGGITVENPEEFVMEDQTFAAGTLQLNGEQALLYSRFRGDDQGDFGRISRQQQVLRAMLDEASEVNVVTTLPTMFTTLSDHFRTDFGVGDLIDIANDYRNDCTADSIETQTIPGVSSMEYDELMQQELSFVISEPEVVQQNVAWVLGQTSDEPIDEIPATPAATLPVSVVGTQERLLRFRSA